MSKIILAALKWHQFLVLAAYIVLLGGYSRYLDSSLKYVSPKIPAATEDILGSGFWVPWAFLATWFAIACVLSYWIGFQRKTSYWIPLLFVFGILSVADFCLYGVLERQVLT